MILVALLALAAFSAPTPPEARAAGPSGDMDGLTLEDRSTVNNSPKIEKKSGEARTKGYELTADEKRYAAEVKRYRILNKQYQQDLQGRAGCLEFFRTPERCSLPSAPRPPGALPRPQVGIRPVGLGLSGEAAAYVAFARLRLAPPKPVITPSPEANRWKMAAVGYPLWLSVGGDLHPPAVSDSVADVHVSLKADVDHVVFNMGDRHKVTCTGLTTRWNRSIPAGQKSPACGYSYQRPSLPRGMYTVTATTYWSVAWSTSVDRGVINIVQSASTQLPVGELQVLVR